MGAAGSVVLNNLLKTGATPAVDAEGNPLSPSEQQARENLVATLVGAIAQAAGLDTNAAITAARIETGNNALAPTPYGTVCVAGTTDGCGMPVDKMLQMDKGKWSPVLQNIAKQLGSDDPESIAAVYNTLAERAAASGQPLSEAQIAQVAAEYKATPAAIALSDFAARYDQAQQDKVEWLKIPANAALSAKLDADAVRLNLQSSDAVSQLLSGAFHSLPPLEISAGVDAYLGIGASASLGVSLDIRTFQLRGSVGASVGVGFGGGVGIGVGAGETGSGFTREISGTVAGGPGSLTISPDGVSGGTGPKFGPDFGLWLALSGKYTTPATPDLVGGNSVK